MFCSNCGCQIPDGSAFCPACGHRTGQAGPTVGSAPGTPRGTFGQILDAVDHAAGGSGHVDIRLANFFDAVFRRHSKGEADTLFACGSPATTPALANVSRVWPHPWLFSRVFLVLLIATLGLWMLSSFFGNPNGYPGLIFVSSLLAPFTVVIFFFETNVPRNLGIARVIEIFFVGGVLSLLCIYPLGAIFPESGTGGLGPALTTGVIEELAKVIVTALFVRRIGGRNFILTGMLVGAAVGAGFDAFETAGYVFSSYTAANQVSLLRDLQGAGVSASAVIQSLSDGIPYRYPQDFQALMDQVLGRMPTGFCTHVTWAAVTGGALGLASNGQRLELSQLSSARFWGFLLVSIVLHGLWDAYVPVLDDYALFGFTLGQILYALIIWVVVFVLLHRGVAQMNQLAAEAQAMMRAYAQAQAQARAAQAQAQALGQPSVSRGH